MLVLQLADQVAQHAAGHLVFQGVDVHAQHLGIQQAAGQRFLADGAEIIRHFQQKFFVQAGIVRGAAEGARHDFGGGLAGAQGEGAHGGVDDVCAGFDAAHVAHGGHTAGVVGVELDRDFNGLLQGFDQFLRFIGDQQAGHVLHTDGVGAHVFHGLGEVREIFHGIGFAEGIGNGSLDVAAVFLGGVHGGLQIAQIVQRVKDADDVDAVVQGFFHEVIHHVIRVVAVAQDVLGAEQHLQFGFFEAGAELAQAVPGVFVQEAERGIEGGAAPAFHGVVTHFVHFFDDGEHLFGGHAGGDQRLVAVAKDGLRDLDGTGIDFRHGDYPLF